VITTWPPRGPVFEVIVLLRQALARVRTEPQRAPGPDWGDPQVLQWLLGPHGSLEVSERELVHSSGEEPEQVWERWERAHPMWIGARAQLQPAGAWQGLREASIGVLRKARRAGAHSSPYLLATLTRS
jgi:hypothetical protein